MESQYKNNGGVDGGQNGKEIEKGGGGGGGGVGMGEVALRVLAMLLSLVAAILLGIDKQTKIVPISISPDLPAFNVPVTAKSSYVSAFGYFVVGNSISCVLAAVSLVLAVASKGGRKGVSVLTIILIDVTMVALLFSGIGSAGAVGVLGMKGNSHLEWNKVCNVYGKFCHQAMAAVTLSLVAAVAYMVLVILGASKLQNRS